MSSKPIVFRALIGVVSFALLPVLSSCGADVCFFSTTGAFVSSVTPDFTFVPSNGVVHLVIVGGTFDRGAVVQLGDGTVLRAVEIRPTRMVVELPQGHVSPSGAVAVRVQDGCRLFSANVVIRTI